MFHKVIFVHRPGQSFSREHVTVAEAIGAVARNNGIETGTPTATNFADERDNRTLFVALGGDGTVLHAAQQAATHPNAAVLGINLGHLGFLAEDVQDLIADGTFKNWIGYCLRENLSYFKYDSRNILHCKAMESLSDPAPKIAGALNEVTFTPKTVAAMLDIEIYINEEFVAKYRGSGALVSTATGSTAMAASSGGAIIAPNTSVLQVVPVLPHDVTIRPIICSSKDVIELRTVLDARTRDLAIACDGHPLVEFDDTRRFANGRTFRAIIEKGHRRVHFMRPTDYSFFATLSKKMGWNHNGKT